MSALQKGINIVADMLIAHLGEVQNKRKRKRRMWVRDWTAKRNSLGASSTFLIEVLVQDYDTYRNHLRLTVTQFEELLSMISTNVQKQDTVMRQALSPRLKLEITLRYIASGDSFSTLEHLYRVPKSTISRFIPDVLKVIYNSLKGGHMKVPSTAQEWENIAKGFNDRWQFVGCCGALDGKHVNIICPKNSNADFYNYKGYFSTVLFALVDSNYRFIYIDVGSNGRANDCTIFRNSSLKRAIENGTLGFPDWGVIAADDAFPLKPYIMKPYCRQGILSVEKRIFNYRLSRARRIVENAFGILAMRFRIFRAPIPLSPDKVDLVVQAVCAIHNWLIDISPTSYISPVDRELQNGHVMLGAWRQEESTGLSTANIKHGSNNFSQQAEAIRRKYMHYFNTEGSVPWQWAQLKLTS